MDNQQDSYQPCEQPQDQPRLPSPPKATVAKTEVPKDTEDESNADKATARELKREFRWFEIASLIVNACLAVTGIFVLCIYTGQLKVMQRQLDQMKGGSAQTDTLISETHNLADAAKKQADASKSIADATKEQSGSTAKLAQAANDQLGELETEVQGIQALATATKETTQATLAQAAISAKALEVNQRPWVSFDMRIISPLTFDAAGAHLSIAVTFKNTGGSAAVSIGYQMEMYRLTGQARITLNSIFVERDRVCQRAKTGVGNSLFVGDHRTESWTIGYPADDVAREVKESGMFMPDIIACIEYRSPIGTTVFETASIMYLSRMPYTDDAGRPSQAIIPPGPIPLESLVLFQDPSFGVSVK